MFNAVPFHQDASFLIIGERTNANGSKKFRDTMLAGDWDSCVRIARDQEREGAHVLDVCVDYGRDGTSTWTRSPPAFATQVTVPLVLDSTEPQVIEASCSAWAAGPFSTRPTWRTARARAALRPGCAGWPRAVRAPRWCACSSTRRARPATSSALRVAHRIHQLATERYGLAPGDLIFDALTFPLSTGDEDLRHDAMYTIEAIRRIKAEPPGVHHARRLQRELGLFPLARHVLNSVFLHEAVEAGLDSAIVHAAASCRSTRSPSTSSRCAST